MKTMSTQYLTHRKMHWSHDFPLQATPGLLTHLNKSINCIMLFRTEFAHDWCVLGQRLRHTLRAVTPILLTRSRGQRHSLLSWLRHSRVITDIGVTSETEHRVLTSCQQDPGCRSVNYLSTLERETRKSWINPRGSLIQYLQFVSN